MLPLACSVANCIVAFSASATEEATTPTKGTFIVNDDEKEVTVTGGGFNADDMNELSKMFVQASNQGKGFKTTVALANGELVRINKPVSPYDFDINSVCGAATYIYTEINGVLYLVVPIGARKNNDGKVTRAEQGFMSVGAKVPFDSQPNEEAPSVVFSKTGILLENPIFAVGDWYATYSTKLKIRDMTKILITRANPSALEGLTPPQKEKLVLIPLRELKDAIDSDSPIKTATLTGDPIDFTPNPTALAFLRHLFDPEGQHKEAKVDDNGDVYHTTFYNTKVLRELYNAIAGTEIAMAPAAAEAPAEAEAMIG